MFDLGVEPATCDFPYVGAVKEVFGADIDFAQLVKLYSSDEVTRGRYSPGDVIQTIPVPITGDPSRENISTSYVERQNFSMRMCMRRLTRLTNGFSKRWENLKALRPVPSPSTDRIARVETGSGIPLRYSQTAEIR